MADDDFAMPRIPSVENTQSRQVNGSQNALGMVVAQEESQDSLQAFIDEGAFSPALMTRRFQTLEERRRKTSKEEEAEQTRKEERLVLAVQKVDQAAEQASKKNPELQQRSLALLRSQINANDTKEEILKKVLEMYPDRSLADEALDFLIETSDGSLSEQVRQAKEELNQNYGREIRAGKNIQAQTQEYAKQGLAPPPQLRFLYRDVTGNPRDANTLFNELTTHFDYEKMKLVIDFLLQSVGSDLRAKGPSIDRGELYRLLSEARKLQGILGIFRFFKSRMNLISSAFSRQGLLFQLSFEGLAKQFMKAVQERYPSADKILQMASQLGISEELLAQIIIFTQMRDAMRQVAPRLFRSNQHRQDLLNAFMDAIEDLDEQLEEKEEEDKTDKEPS